MAFGSMDNRLFGATGKPGGSNDAQRVSLVEWQNEVLGIFDLTILPNVFSPKYFTDSLWFAETLPKIVGTGSLLEVGSGTGIVSLYCADAGASVTATDISPEASQNTALNARRNGQRVSVCNGDMFEAIRENEKFDFIFWNHPFNNWDTPVDDMLLRAGLDERYAGLRKYVSEGPGHLSEGGSLLLGTGDMADLKEIEKIAEENGCRLAFLDSVELPVEHGGSVSNSYLIYRFDRKEK